jgi:catechol 2,3-dioxygenase-like lactoylglutathione lyase family enzyme
MLRDLRPYATLATADMAKARSFYEETLGLTVQTDSPFGVTYNCGDGQVFLYESAYAGTNKATAVSFEASVESFDDEIEALRQKGISFMTFDMEGMEWDNGVAIAGPTKSVWFSDPDGNILNVSAGEM